MNASVILVVILVALVEVGGFASLVAGMVSAFVHGHFQSWRALVWVIVGTVGLPLLLLSFAYIVGFAITLVLFGLSTVCSRRRSSWLLLPSLCTVASTVFVGSATETFSAENAFIAAFVIVSAGCAFFAVAKLGDAFGRDTIWRDRFRASPLLSA